MAMSMNMAMATTMRLSRRCMSLRLFSVGASRAITSDSNALTKAKYEEMSSRAEELKLQLELRQIQREMQQFNLEDKMGKKLTTAGGLQLSDVEKLFPMDPPAIDDQLSDGEQGLEGPLEQMISGTSVDALEKKFEEGNEQMSRKIIDAVEKMLDERLGSMTDTISSMSDAISEISDEVVNEDDMRMAMKDALDEKLEDVLDEKLEELVDDRLKPMNEEFLDSMKDVIKDSIEDLDMDGPLEEKLQELLEPVKEAINNLEKKLANVGNGLEPVKENLPEADSKEETESDSEDDDDTASDSEDDDPSSGSEEDDDQESKTTAVAEIKGNIRTRVQNIKQLLAHEQVKIWHTQRVRIDNEFEAIEELIKPETDAVEE